MKTKAFKILILVLFIGINGYTQIRNSPKQLKFKEIFYHSESKTKFPKIIEKYNLTEVYSFDKKDKNVSVKYENENTQINIYIYPDEVGIEGRLRNSFLSTYNAIFNNDKEIKNLKIINHKGEKYICNGIRGISKNENNENSLLTMFECGTWMFKIRISSSELSNQDLIELEKEITKKIDPSKLTGLKLFNLRGDIILSKLAMKDSTLLVSTLGYAYKKFEWLIKNLDENEKYSGFQDLYIDMHKEALKQFVSFEHEHKFSSSEPTKEYLKKLNQIIDSPFFNEFLMEEYNYILIIPENVILNFEGYHKWKKENDFNFELDKLLCKTKYST